MECSTQSDTKFDLEGWSIDHSAGRPILMHSNCSVIEAEQAYGLLKLIKRAAQPQGEPVAHCFLRRNGAGEWVNDAKRWAEGAPCREILAECEKHPELYRVRLAYAEQPAPVAVITYQQVFKAYEYAESHPHKYLRGTTNWCAAVAHSLNTK